MEFIHRRRAIAKLATPFTRGWFPCRQSEAKPCVSNDGVQAFALVPQIQAGMFVPPVNEHGKTNGIDMLGSHHSTTG